MTADTQEFARHAFSARSSPFRWRQFGFSVRSSYFVVASIGLSSRWSVRSCWRSLVHRLWIAVGAGFEWILVDLSRVARRPQSFEAEVDLLGGLVGQQLSVVEGLRWRRHQESDAQVFCHLN